MVQHDRESYVDPTAYRPTMKRYLSPDRTESTEFSLSGCCLHSSCSSFKVSLSGNAVVESSLERCTGYVRSWASQLIL